MKIKDVRYYKCGECVNLEAALFYGGPLKPLVFPAGVFVIEHAERGLIVFDTGYHARAQESLHPRDLIYRLPNPIRMTPEQTISYQLQAEGVLDQVQLVILSHFHPDHTGDLKQFQGVDVMASRESYKRPGRPFFKSHLPEDLESRLYLVDFESGLLPELHAADLLGDRSIYGVKLPGHAHGQMGLYLPDLDLLLCADALWNTRDRNRLDEIKTVAKLIQANWRDYKRTGELINRIMSGGTRVISSHDPEARARWVLKEVLHGQNK